MAKQAVPPDKPDRFLSIEFDGTRFELTERVLSTLIEVYENDVTGGGL